MSEDEARVAAKEMAAGAETANGLRCEYGKEAVFWLEDTRARVPGHIYSDAGRREYRITRMCEFHFDEVMAPPDDEDEE